MAKEIKGIRRKAYWYFIWTLLIVGINGVLCVVFAIDSIADIVSRVFNFYLFMYWLGYIFLFFIFSMLTFISLDLINRFEDRY